MKFVGFSGRKNITKADVESLRGTGVHRICFAHQHAKEPKRADPPNIGFFNVPFLNSVGFILGEETDLELFKGKYGYFRSIQSESEFRTIDTWCRGQGTRIFLRDCLDLSIALDQNLVDNESGTYTHLGALEARAKNAPDEAALSELTDIIADQIRSLPGYRNAPFIAAVPPKPGKTYDLPSVLAARVTASLGKEDLTPRFSFKEKKGTVKQLPVDQKWEAWESTGLELSPPIKGGAVILVDDKYQSGTTLQFVASKLINAGADKVFGLCIVKTLRDTDNT
ncbi:hypothetical protein [Oleispirillum naphthae]|uniref:hypothetical protein n=1 Tax=Oleispirillum naphthae TaxID=2838853 RepID=UPI00308260A7